LVFRHIKLKLLTKASILCLSHTSMSITTWFMSFSQLHVCEKLHICSFSQGYKWKTTTYKIMKTCSLSYLPWYFKSKIRDGRIFSLVHLTWNNPKAVSSSLYINMQYPCVMRGGFNMSAETKSLVLVALSEWNLQHSKLNILEVTACFQHTWCMLPYQIMC
jgi:uncharacterized ion transporter superfamily protein YfcC